MILVLDWRNFVKNMSYSIMSSSIACAYPTEPEEIAHRVMKRLFCIRAEYPTATIVIANDHRPYWRHQFLLDWYSNKGWEPVIYKGNRDKISWPFATDSVTMESLYSQLLDHGAKAIGSVVVGDKGLEADDIWGIITATAGCDVLGYSGDSDWCQCINNRVKVYDFTTDTLRTEKADIRLKWIGGDSGDNIRGCTKLKKDGTPAQKGYGKKTAKDLLEDPDWQSKLPADELERNRTVTTLPCPLWNLEVVAEELDEVSTVHEQSDEFWDRYGVTEPVRKLMIVKANRDAFIAKLRLYMLAKKEEEI